MPPTISFGGSGEDALSSGGTGCILPSWLPVFNRGGRDNRILLPIAFVSGGVVTGNTGDPNIGGWVDRIGRG